MRRSSRSSRSFAREDRIASRCVMRRQISKPEGPPRRQFFPSFPRPFFPFPIYRPLPPPRRVSRKFYFKRASRGQRGFHGKESIVQPVIVVGIPECFTNTRSSFRFNGVGSPVHTTRPNNRRHSRDASCTLHSAFCNFDIPRRAYTLAYDGAGERERSGRREGRCARNCISARVSRSRVFINLHCRRRTYINNADCLVNPRANGRIYREIRGAARDDNLPRAPSDIRGRPI